VSLDLGQRGAAGGRGDDAITGLGGLMDQHGARVHQLPDLERLQGAQQRTSPIDIDLLVERIVFAGEIEVGGQVDDAGDA
jgi:hypothetical protein